MKIKQKAGKKWAAGIIAFSVAMFIVMCLQMETASAAEKTFKWRAQTWSVPGSVSFKAQEAALMHLKDATNGRLEIKLFGPGAIVGAFEGLDAMSNGIYEVGLNAPAYYAGKEPAFAVFFDVNCLFRNSFDANVWIYGFGGKELAQELYAKYKIHYVGPIMMSDEPIMSKVPLNKLADFKGIKIRTPAGLTAALFKRLGANPVATPGGEIYTALDTGVVDAAEWITLADNWDIGLHEVSKYVLYPSFHATVDICDLTVSQKAWDKLPPDLKAAIEIAQHEISEMNDIKGEIASKDILSKMIARGIVHNQLSDKDYQEVYKLAVEETKIYAEKSPFTKKVIDSIFDYLKAMGRIK